MNRALRQCLIRAEAGASARVRPTIIPVRSPQPFARHVVPLRASSDREPIRPPSETRCGGSRSSANGYAPCGRVPTVIGPRSHTTPPARGLVLDRPADLVPPRRVAEHARRADRPAAERDGCWPRPPTRSRSARSTATRPPPAPPRPRRARRDRRRLGRPADRAPGGPSACWSPLPSPTT
jgi:hypothetical protein